VEQRAHAEVEKKAHEDFMKLQVERQWILKEKAR